MHSTIPGLLRPQRLGRRVGFLIPAAILVLSAWWQVPSVLAQSEPVFPSEIYERLTAQEQELAALRHRLPRWEQGVDRHGESTVADSRADLPPTIEDVIPSAKPTRPSPQKWTTKLGGQVMFDYINWMDASPAIQDSAQDVSSWRRIRFNYDATGYDVYDFRVQFDLDGKSDATNGIPFPFVAMKDVYLGIRDLPLNGRLRFGNFFVPFSLDQLTPLPNTQFMERSIPSAGIFSPDREVGLASYHIADDLNRTFSVRVFFDDIPESTKQVVDDNQGIRLSARGTWLPFYEECPDGQNLIHTGMGFVYTDDRNDVVRIRARPGELRETQRLIDSGFISASGYSVGNIEFARVTGPLSFQSEWFITSVNRIATTNVTFYGGYIQASYFSTGEHRKYDRDGNHLAHFGRVTPFSSFFWTPNGNGWGAWEIKARWSCLDFGEVDRGRYDEMTVGVNWYLHEHSQAPQTLGSS